MPRYVKLVLVLIALATGGCESCDGCNANESWLEGASRDDPGSLDEERTAGDAGHAVDGSIPAQYLRGSAKLRESLNQLEESLDILAEAVKSGIAAEEGDSPCERALTGLSGMLRYMKAHSRSGEFENFPPSIVFINFCEGLEIEAQRCMVLSYSNEHKEECARVFEELPDETKSQLERLMTGK